MTIEVDYRRLCNTGKEMYRAAAGLTANAFNHQEFHELAHAAAIEGNRFEEHMDGCEFCVDAISTEG